MLYQDINCNRYINAGPLLPALIMLMWGKNAKNFPKYTFHVNNHLRYLPFQVFYDITMSLLKYLLLLT